LTDAGVSDSSLLDLAKWPNGDSSQQCNRPGRLQMTEAEKAKFVNEVVIRIAAN
jgi:hypothetical protein